MKKIPTLFERVFENHKATFITKNIHPGMEWVLRGEGIATVQMDGNCCAIIDGKLYKRLDVKEGEIPAGAIPCCAPDTVTGHWLYWVPVNPNIAEDKWFVEAFASRGNPKTAPAMTFLYLIKRFVPLSECPQAGS